MTEKLYPFNEDTNKDNHEVLDEYIRFPSHFMAHDQRQNYLSPHPEINERLINLQPDELLLDRFKIIRPLGENTDTVYLAEDKLRLHKRALKIYEVYPFNHQHIEQHLKNQIDLNDQISDPEYSIKVYDIHRIPYGGINLMALSMEFAEEGSLRKWISQHYSCS